MNNEVLELLDKTSKLDLSKIKARVTKENSWTDEHASVVENQYKMFFSLIGSNLGDGLSPPTTDIDLFWHAHIIHTMKYAKDCKSIHGKFLHHHPLNESSSIESDSAKVFCDVFSVQLSLEEISALQISNDNMSQCSERGCKGHSDDDIIQCTGNGDDWDDNH